MLKIQKQIRKHYFRDKPAVLATAGSYIIRQSLPLERLQELQLKRLNKLLNHALSNVPYYKILLREAGLVHNDQIILESLSQLEQIPFLTREIIKTKNSELYSSDHRERSSYKNSSGGSTGEPVTLLQDKNYRIADEACLVQLKNWRGVDPFDSEIFIWGAERDTFEGKKPIISKLADFLRNRIIVNSFKLTDRDKKKIIDLLNRHRPSMIRAYTESIYAVADYAKRNNIEVAPQKVIHTGASKLYDFMRETITDVFKCDLYDHYGGREVGSIATECSAHDGLHLLMEHNLVEIVDRDGHPCRSGQEGAIVVTNLNNYAMPIIRYKIGDYGVMKEYRLCSCGCGYPKLDSVLGRETDIFKNSAGDIVLPEYFIHLVGVVFNDGGIEKFQVIQEELDKISIKIVGSDNLSDTVKNNIVEKIKTVMGQTCRVSFEFVDSIPATQSGKYRYTISELEKIEQK